MIKVEQTYDENPSEVRHIKPEDYDGPKRSLELEAHWAKFKSTDPKYYRNTVAFKNWRKEQDRKLVSHEKAYQEQSIEPEPVKQTEYDVDGVYIGPMDSQDIAYED